MSAMPADLRYERPADLPSALALLREEGAVPLAGGQSLLAAMKLGMNESRCLVDLQGIASLRKIEMHGEHLRIGAMATHAQVAASELVQAFAPGLCALAKGIADQQVRNMGTLGGSLANNDPAACWPAAVLSCDARIHTTQRQIAAGDFFQGLYSTALQAGELITAIEFPALAQFEYIKFEQKASRFALVGVALALQGQKARVAITGLGSGVRLWPEAGAVLSEPLSVKALDALVFPETLALGDLHASAAYRAHLARVLTRRCVAKISGENPALAGMKSAQTAINTVANTTHHASPANPAKGMQMQGEQMLPSPVQRVWQLLLDPATLRRCIAGCESFDLVREGEYVAKVKVGLGPVSAHFKVQVTLHDIQPLQSCTLQFAGSAGALGSGEGSARVQLTALDAARTRLEWQSGSQVSGKLAQLGSRLVQASANKLSEDFFKKFAQVLQETSGIAPVKPEPSGLWQRLQQFIQQMFRR
jgi:CO/xanthine dehydrogenase FAD-binding subunit/carbon monoxide dehydrogenase subunit G